MCGRAASISWRSRSISFCSSLWLGVSATSTHTASFCHCSASVTQGRAQIHRHGDQADAPTPEGTSFVKEQVVQCRAHSQGPQTDHRAVCGLWKDSVASQLGVQHHTGYPQGKVGHHGCDPTCSFKKLASEPILHPQQNVFTTLICSHAQDVL